MHGTFCVLVHDCVKVILTKYIYKTTYALKVGVLEQNGNF